jgi:hypothetical protein
LEEGTALPVSGVPQSSQNLEAGLLSAAHFGQRRASGLPHSAQNFLALVLSVPHFERCIGVRSTETNVPRLYHVCTLKGICLFSSWRSSRPAKVFSQSSRIGGPNSWPIAESRARSPNIPAFQTSNAPYSRRDRLVNRTSGNQSRKTKWRTLSPWDNGTMGQNHLLVVTEVSRANK